MVSGVPGTPYSWLKKVLWFSESLVPLELVVEVPSVVSGVSGTPYSWLKKVLWFSESLVPLELVVEVPSVV